MPVVIDNFKLKLHSSQWSNKEDLMTLEDELCKIERIEKENGGRNPNALIPRLQRWWKKILDNWDDMRGN
jgi:hypothetical protein